MLYIGPRHGEGGRGRRGYRPTLLICGTAKTIKPRRLVVVVRGSVAPRHVPISPPLTCKNSGSGRGAFPLVSLPFSRGFGLGGRGWAPPGLWGVPPVAPRGARVASAYVGSLPLLQCFLRPWRSEWRRGEGRAHCLEEGEGVLVLSSHSTVLGVQRKFLPRSPLVFQSLKKLVHTSSSILQRPYSSPIFEET